MGNMYSDIVPWNPFKGCLFECKYCIPSFQRQAKRHDKICKYKSDTINPETGLPRSKCYTYEPHFHPERLKKLPTVKENEWIWVGSSGDISFAKREWIYQIFKVIRKHFTKTFFFQTKNPKWFSNFDFPKNTVLGITLETNRTVNINGKLYGIDYASISKAMYPLDRYEIFRKIQHPRKVVTIEPIMDFDMNEFIKWIKWIAPERVYIGYDSHKCQLPEPTLEKTRELIAHLTTFTVVKEKLMRESNNAP